MKIRFVVDARTSLGRFFKDDELICSDAFGQALVRNGDAVEVKPPSVPPEGGKVMTKKGKGKGKGKGKK